jgi:hypothetical protein
VETAATPLTSTRQKKAGLRAAVRAVDTQAAQATHVIVQRLSNRQDIATGSVYFTHDPATGAVDITSASQLPDALTYQRADGNRFTFTWGT